MKTWKSSFGAAVASSVLLLGATAAPAAAAPPNRLDIRIWNIYSEGDEIVVKNATAGRAIALLTKECGYTREEAKIFFVDVAVENPGSRTDGGCGEFGSGRTVEIVSFAPR